MTEPDEGDYARGERMLHILDRAYQRMCSVEHGPDDWEDYVQDIRELCDGPEDAFEMIAVMMARDAWLLWSQGLSPSYSWAAFYRNKNELTED